MIKILSIKNLKLFLEISKLFCGLLLILVGFSSCKSIPFVTVTKEKNFDDFLFKVQERSESEYFSCDQVDLAISDGGERNVRAKVYIHKDEYIFADIVFLGFELGRIEITSDSLKFINRIDKTYFFCKMKEANTIFDTGLSYNQLESLLLKGIAIGKKENRRKFADKISLQNDSFIFTYHNQSDVIVRSFFDVNTFKESKIEIVNGNAGFYLLALLDSYNDKENYPGSVKIHLFKGDHKVDMTVKVGKISFAKFEKRSFEVNSKYREISY